MTPVHASDLSTTEDATSPPIRLLVADGRPSALSELSALLEQESDMAVVAEVGRGDEIVEAALQARPDVAVIAIEMPGMDGITASGQLRYELPDCHVIIVTALGRIDELERAMDAGATGFLVADATSAELAAVVRDVRDGLRVIDPRLTAESRAQDGSPLTDRETDVLSVARAGGSIADLARVMHLSESLVRNHLSNAIAKTGGRNRADAIRIAQEGGWF
ncbi:DNA-binding response regulator [Microbacterium sp. P01]|uniref:response regulator transcription factor n=1 Tax=Microbacterium sp. P01 TaxID=3366261 RepID=UPI00366B9687